MLLLIRIILCCQVVRGDCPDGWTRRGDTVWCYKAFEKSGDQGVTWNQAQGTCVKYGADLVSYESKSEMEWVYNIMNWNQNSGSWRYYWNGLNDLQTKGKLEWVSTHPGQGLTDIISRWTVCRGPVSKQTVFNYEIGKPGKGQEISYTFNNFGVDADMHDSSRRCTFSLFSNNLPLDYGHEGKWYKEKCEKTKGSFLFVGTLHLSDWTSQSMFLDCNFKPY